MLRGVKSSAAKTQLLRLNSTWLYWLLLQYMYGILESWTHVWVGGDTVARSHLGFPANLRNSFLQKTEKNAKSYKYCICKGFKDEISQTKTNLITQKIYSFSKLPLKTKNRSFWTTCHSDHAVTRGRVWRLASPRLRLGIVASLLSVSTVLDPNILSG